MLAMTDTRLTDARQRYQCSVSNNQNCRKLKYKSKRRNKMGTLDRVVVAMISTQSGYDFVLWDSVIRRQQVASMEFNHGHCATQKKEVVSETWQSLFTCMDTAPYFNTITGILGTCQNLSQRFEALASRNSDDWLTQWPPKFLGCLGWTLGCNHQFWTTQEPNCKD